MTQVQANRAVIEDYYRAMQAGDFAHVVSLHAPDLVCWMSGRSRVSGRFQGRDELYAHMGQNVLGPLIFGSEPYVKDAHVVVTDGDYVCGVMHGGLPAHDGGRYDQYYLQVFRMRDQRIAEIVEIFDTAMVEHVLMKNRLVIPRARPARPFDLGAAPGASQMTRDQVVALVSRFGQQLAEGALQDQTVPLHADFTLAMLGTTPLSGLSNRLDPLLRLIREGGDLRSPRLVCADDRAAVLLGRARDGNSHQQYGLLVACRDQAISRVTVFFDTVEAEHRLFVNPHCPGTTSSIMPPFDVEKAFAG